MFKRKKQDQELISINDGEGYFVDKAVRDYIYKLRSELLEASSMIFCPFSRKKSSNRLLVRIAAIVFIA